MIKESSPKSMQRRRYYEENYEIMQHLELEPGQKKYIGSRKNRICRYCSKGIPETSFRNVAHAFPEFISNRVLISNDECDNCNDKFSNSIEVHLARYLGIESTIAQIPGKRGVPKYSVPGKGPRVEYSTEENLLKAEANMADAFLDIHGSEKRFVIHSYRQPYIKRSVYKCIVKMAIAIMPRDELPNFRRTIDWINISNPKDDLFKTDSLICIRTRSVKSLHAIDALLLRRKDPSSLIPYSIFFIAFYNFSFQIFLPFSEKDKHLKDQTVNLCPFPTKMERFTDVTYLIENMSSNETVQGEKNDILLSYSGEVTIEKVDRNSKPKTDS